MILTFPTYNAVENYFREEFDDDMMMHCVLIPEACPKQALLEHQNQAIASVAQKFTKTKMLERGSQGDHGAKASEDMLQNEDFGHIWLEAQQNAKEAMTFFHVHVTSTQEDLLICAIPTL